MKERMDISKTEPSVFNAMLAHEKLISEFGFDKKLVLLIKLRVSQINGCGYCVNMHSRDARKAGETEQRLYTVCTWWEVPFFSPKECAALKFAEEVTHIDQGGLSDATYQAAVEHFGIEKVAQLLFIVTVINSWNRITISTHKIAERE
jgi:AhpD family alkylhydroperoxidase